MTTPPQHTVQEHPAPPPPPSAQAQLTHQLCAHARVIITYQHTPAVCMHALLLLISTHQLCACARYYSSAHTGCVHACYYYLSAWWKQVPVGCTVGVALGTRQAGTRALASYKGNGTAFEQNSFLLSLLMIWFPFPLMFSQGEHTSLVHKTRTNWWEDKTWLAETNKTLQCPFKLASWMGSGQNHSKCCCSFFVVVCFRFVGGGGGGPEAKKTMTTTTKTRMLNIHNTFTIFLLH